MQKLKFLFIVIILFSLIGTTQAGTVETNGKTWTCDGTADQIEINQALEDGDHVVLSGSFVISEPIIIDSNTILEGKDEAVVKLKDHANWKKYRGMFEAIGCENVSVYGFEVDGNEPNQNEECGACFYTIMLFDGSSDLVFHDLYLHDNCNDGIRVFNEESKDCDLTVYDCTFERCYHNGVYLHKANGAKIYNNKFVPRTNAGICATDSNHLSIHDNVVDTGTPPTGGAGFEIQKTTNLKMDDIEVYNNDISNTNLPGIWLYAYKAYEKDTAEDVYIHDNTITGCGMGRGTDHYYGGGVVIQGFNNTILENNIIKDNYNEGVTLGNVYSNPPNYNFVTVLKGNTITGTIAGTYRDGKDLSVSSKYSYVSDGKIPDNKKDDEEDDKDGNGEGEDGVKVIPDNETEDENPYDDYYEPEPAREFEMDSIFDVLDMEFSDSAYIEQGVMNPTKEWETKGKYTRAWIDIPGYEGLLKIGNNTYIPKSPEECAIVMYDTENLADRPKGQTSTEKVYTEDGVLKVDLTVKTKYEVQAYKTYIIFGQKVRIPYYKTKSETVTFTKSFENVPDIFPAFNPPKVYVTNYNGSHVIVYIPKIDGIVRADTDYNYSSCTERRLIGYIGTATNGFRSTEFERIDSWAFSGPQMSRSSKGVYITEDNFDINKLNVTVVTPYDSFKITDFEYKVIEDDSRKVINYALFAFVVCIWIYGRAIYKVLYMFVRRWF